MVDFIKKPNFFIVGAAKSGTTSLWNALIQHPSVYMPQNLLDKEPCYFSNYPYRLDLSRYCKLFSGVGKKHKWIGEASTVYLTDPNSPQQIHKFNPKAKIIISLRNPVDRAYSLYNWMVQDGYEWAHSFEKALRIETERMNKNIPNWFEPQYYWNYLYFHSGLYFQQVKRYLELFGQNVYIIDFDNLKKDFTKEYTKLCNFFQIESIDIKNEQLNKSREAHSAQIQFLLRKLTDLCLSNRSLFMKHDDSKLLMMIIYIFLTRNIQLCIKNRYYVNPIILIQIFLRVKRLLHQNRLCIHNGKTKSDRDIMLKFGLNMNKPPKLNKEIRQTLLKKYQPDILNLEELLGRSFKQWKNNNQSL